MKSGADYLKGLLLILVSTITYFVCRNQDFDWDVTTVGVFGKLRIIVGLFYLLFGNIYGATIGVIVGLWFVFRK